MCACESNARNRGGPARALNLSTSCLGLSRIFALLELGCVQRVAETQMFLLNFDVAMQVWSTSLYVPMNKVLGMDEGQHQLSRLEPSSVGAISRCLHFWSRAVALVQESPRANVWTLRWQGKCRPPSLYLCACEWGARNR